MEILGIDIGGSGIKGALVNTLTGQLTTERYRLPTPDPSSPAAVAGCLVDIAKKFDYHDKPIGVGFPAVVMSGKVLTASNIKKTWIGKNAGNIFSKATDSEVFVINDADAAGMAEMNFGAGKDAMGVTLLITIGTGLGSVLFSDGNLVPNTEFGHLIFKGDIAEKYCSDAARKRDELDWMQWGKRFNKYLRHLEKLLNPDRIILGGGASKKFDLYSEYFETKCEVMPAMLRNQAGIIGAATYAMSKNK